MVTVVTMRKRRWRLMGAFFVALILTALIPSAVSAHDGINRLTNEFRIERGRRPLRTNDNLQRIANDRARAIYYNGFYHDFSWWSRTRCSAIGENIAYRRPALERARGRWFFKAWRDSRPHRHNMLGWGWRRHASAIFLAPDGGMYGVQLFCKP